jgi:DNA transformation protein
MGEKGGKKAKESDAMAASMIKELNPLKGISTKKMFGGYGIFHDNVMFGIIDSKGTPFFKINDEIIADFESNGGVQHSRMPYFSIPAKIMANQENLIEWANRSILLSK